MLSSRTAEQRLAVESSLQHPRAYELGCQWSRSPASRAYTRGKALGARMAQQNFLEGAKETSPLLNPAHGGLAPLRG